MVIVNNNMPMCVYLHAWIHNERYTINNNCVLNFTDVHDLTAKLKLMEAGGETTTEPVVAADHHIYCNIHHIGKEALLGTLLYLTLVTSYTF